jgi:muramoyltetrapeptide carboxypeptidase LdcA involved in peptidoglycan recycling
MISNYLYKCRQNGVFDKINALWIGNYEHESMISLEKIVLDVLEDDYKFPIIKSDNFGHGFLKTVIPIGVRARVNTEADWKIELLESPLENKGCEEECIIHGKNLKKE